MAASYVSSTDRRVHPRFSALALRGLHAARVKYGEDISVINLSAGGVWFETAARLTPDSTIVLEFLGPDGSALVPARVLRCQALPASHGSARSKGACAFKRLLRIKALVTGAVMHFDAELTIEGGGVWQPVVGKFRDGRLVHGYTSDFSPSKSSLRISPTPTVKKAHSMSLNDFEAIFFLHEAPAANGGKATIARETSAPYGRKVALVLPSGEELVGSTLNYTRDGSGFFIHPADDSFGVARVFITQSGIRHVRLL